VEKSETFSFPYYSGHLSHVGDWQDRIFGLNDGMGRGHKLGFSAFDKKFFYYPFCLSFEGSGYWHVGNESGLDDHILLGLYVQGQLSLMETTRSGLLVDDLSRKSLESRGSF
jgi:hypothetical protein